MRLRLELGLRLLELATDELVERALDGASVTGMMSVVGVTLWSRTGTEFGVCIGAATGRGIFSMEREREEGTADIGLSSHT